MAGDCTFMNATGVRALGSAGVRRGCRWCSAWGDSTGVRGSSPARSGSKDTAALGSAHARIEYKFL